MPSVDKVRVFGDSGNEAEVEITTVDNKKVQYKKLFATAVKEVKRRKGTTTTQATFYQSQRR